MTADTITISSQVADALTLLDLGDFNRVEAPERMAYVLLILKKLDDRPEWFPRGKWATIQAIEAQLDACADEQAKLINASPRVPGVISSGD